MVRPMTNFCWSLFDLPASGGTCVEKPVVYPGTRETRGGAEADCRSRAATIDLAVKPCLPMLHRVIRILGRLIMREEMGRGRGRVCVYMCVDGRARVCMGCKKGS